MTKILILSDLHLGKGELDKEQVEVVEKFFQIYVKKIIKFQFTHLFLLGDIIELWKTRMEDTPKTVFELIDLSPLLQKFVKFIKEIIGKGITVLYFRGNHDDNITESECKKIFGNQIHFCKVVKFCNIHFEHGDRLDMLNFPSRKLRCIGYYAARYVASYKVDSFNSLSLWEKIKFGAYAAFLYYFYSKFQKISKNLWGKIVEKLFEKSKDEDVIIMSKKEKIKVKEVKKMYIKVIDNAINFEKSLFKALISAIMNNQEKILESKEFCKKFNLLNSESNKENVIVLGHNHHEALKNYDHCVCLNVGSILKAFDDKIEKKTHFCFGEITIENGRAKKIEMKSFKKIGKKKGKKKDEELEFKVKIVKSHTFELKEKEKKLKKNELNLNFEKYDYDFDSKITPLIGIKKIIS